MSSGSEKTSYIKEYISSFREVFIASLKGNEVNIVDGNINRAILLLAIPMMLEMVMESLFAVVDIFFVSKIGVNAIAVVGLTESVLTIVYSLGIGLAMGTTALVSRRVGEKNIAKAAISGVQAIYLGFFASLLIGVPGYIYAEDLLRFMGADESVIAEGVGFTRLMLGSNVIIMLLFLINGIFRGAGDAALAMRALWISNGINIVLDPILIFGFGPIPAFGLEGAALATIIGRGIGVIYQLYHLFYGKGLIKVHKENWQLVQKVVVKLIKISSGGTGQFIIASASWIFLMRIMSEFGSAALAGYTLGIRVMVFTLLPAWGIANAAATMVGQNLGARQADRAEQSVWKTSIYNMVYMGLVMVIYLLFAEEIISFFSGDKEVIAYAVKCLVTLSYGYIFYALGMVLVQSFNGSGDTRTPTIVNFFVFWTFQIPLAYFLATHLSLGPEGVYWAIVIAESTLTLTVLFLFRRGKWKTVAV
jgi:putative MATE family efflux protein